MAEQTGRWALILGASSGFGAATAQALARAGYGIFGVHLDRRATMPQVEAIQAGIQAAGQEAIFFNVNAADAEKRAEVVRAGRPPPRRPAVAGCHHSAVVRRPHLIEAG